MSDNSGILSKILAGCHPKYELDHDDTTIVSDPHTDRYITLYRVVALRDFGDVVKGQRGGFIERRGNLSEKDDCFVYDHGKVWGISSVYGNAKILGDASVGHGCQIRGNAEVSGFAKVYNSIVEGDARIDDAALISHSHVYGSAVIAGTTRVRGASLEQGEHFSGTIREPRLSIYIPQPTALVI